MRIAKIDIGSNESTCEKDGFHFVLSLKHHTSELAVNFWLLVRIPNVGGKATNIMVDFFPSVEWSWKLLKSFKIYLFWWNITLPSWLQASSWSFGCWGKAAYTVAFSKIRVCYRNFTLIKIYLYWWNTTFPSVFQASGRCFGCGARRPWMCASSRTPSNSSPPSSTKLTMSWG